MKTVLKGFIAICAYFILIWFFGTVLYWIAEHRYGNDLTFFELIKSQWEVIKNLRMW